MTDHQDLAARVAEELVPRPDVLAVLIAGSVGRGEQVASSDVDLLIVRAADSALATADRAVRDGLLVECIARTEDEWRTRLVRAGTSWLYAFLEAEVFYDGGPAGRLVADANNVLQTFKTSAEDRGRIAALLWHNQARLDRADSAADDRQQGYWSSLLVELVIHGLYAIHDVPRPPSTRQLANLHRVPLTERESALLEAMLTGDARIRFNATRSLVAYLRTALGPPDLEHL